MRVFDICSTAVRRSGSFASINYLKLESYSSAHAVRRCSRSAVTAPVLMSICSTQYCSTARNVAAVFLVRKERIGIGTCSKRSSGHRDESDCDSCESHFCNGGETTPLNGESYCTSFLWKNNSRSFAGISL